MAELARIGSEIGSHFATQPSLIGVGASALSGGLFGVLGTVAGRVAGFFERRQSFAQERARWSHEMALLELQAKTRAAETEAEHRLADTQGAWQALAGSYEAEARIGDSYKWVNAVRALTRPTLTVLLWAVALMIFAGTGKASGAPQAFVETITFAATAATLWWFGDRSRARP